jgi:hypothetical protein
MSKFTREQKAALLGLAERYGPEILAVAKRGGAEDVSVLNRDEALLFERFADGIVAKVFRDHSDVEGEHGDINADAELVVHMIADVLAEYEREG